MRQSRHNGLHRPMKVLLISSSEEAAEDISSSLKQRWPDVNLLIVLDGKRALDSLEHELPDIVILDTDSPKGFTLLKRTRAFSNAPVIALIAQDKPLDEIRALQQGADDCLIKPPDRLRLPARVSALLRRISRDSVDTGSISPNDDLQIDFAARTIVPDKEVIGLTPTECKLLYHLVKREGRPVQKEALIRKVWGPEYLNFGGEEELRRYIHRLRSKLRQRGDQIVTRWGAGYLFASRNASRWGKL